MADISKEQAVQLAREAGTPYVNRHYPGQTSFGFTEESLLTFAQAAFKLGRNAGLDAAKKKVSEMARAIESLKDNTP